MTLKTAEDWIAFIESQAAFLTENSSKHDREFSFAESNYSLLAEKGFLKAMIPKSLGGHGLSHGEMCDCIRKIAHFCPSTALAISMHQHLVASTIWKYRNQQEGEALLRQVVDRNLVLVSTGARDWLESSGNMKKVDGGYLVSGKKQFASQSAIGDVMVTSARYAHKEKGEQVIHFTLSMDSDGVFLEDDWYTLGMRGTGSQTVTLKDAFVPESAITLIRSRDTIPDVWHVVLTVAPPLIMAPYVGIAEAAKAIAIQYCRKANRTREDIPLLLGELDNFLCMAILAYTDMIALANNGVIQPEEKTSLAMLSRKTILSDACKATVDKAMEAVGGKSFFRSLELEKLFRDVQAVRFHPLPKKQQMRLLGEYLLENFQP